MPWLPFKDTETNSAWSDESPLDRAARKQEPYCSEHRPLRYTQVSASRQRPSGFSGLRQSSQCDRLWDLIQTRGRVVQISFELI